MGVNLPPIIKIMIENKQKRYSYYLELLELSSNGKITLNKEQSQWINAVLLERVNDPDLIDEEINKSLGMPLNMPTILMNEFREVQSIRQEIRNTKRMLKFFKEKVGII